MRLLFSDGRVLLWRWGRGVWDVPAMHASGAVVQLRTTEVRMQPFALQLLEEAFLAVPDSKLLLGAVVVDVQIDAQ